MVDKAGKEINLGDTVEMWVKSDMVRGIVAELNVEKIYVRVKYVTDKGKNRTRLELAKHNVSVV